MAEPSREQLLALMHANERQLCESKDAPAAQCEAVFNFYREQWKENHPDPSPVSRARQEILHPMEREHQRTKREQLQKNLKDLGVPEPKSIEEMDRDAVEKLLPKESATEVLDREVREMRERLEPPPPDISNVSTYSETKPFSPDPPWHKRPDLVLAVILFCLGGVLAIGLVLLPRESPGAIIFWLAIMLFLLAACELLLAHFLNLSKPKALVGLIAPAILVFSFGWYIWPPQMHEPLDKGLRQSSPLPLASPTASVSPIPTTTPRLTPSPASRQTNSGLRRPQSRCSAEDRLLGRC
jgi:hypothetical protein